MAALAAGLAPTAAATTWSACRCSSRPPARPWPPRRAACRWCSADWTGPDGDCRFQQSTRLGSYIRWHCRRAAAIIAPGRPIHAELLAAGYSPTRLCCLPNGVQIGPPRSAAARAAARAALAEAQPFLAIPRDYPLAVYTGRLHPRKGLHDLLMAWRLVGATRPEARLWLVGDGPQRPALQSQIAALGLLGRVVLAGAFDAVDELLAAADLFVFPSLEEGTSLSLLEAMAAGLPIAACDIPPNRDVACDGQQALLTPPGQPDALAGAIRRLLDEPELAARLGEAARERAAAEFSLARWSKRTWRCLKKWYSDYDQRICLAPRHPEGTEISQPRVAAQRLPWVDDRLAAPTP